VVDERKGECQGRRDRCTLGDACPKFGLLGRVSRDGARRVKGCGDPVARGKRNRAKGDSKARRARKTLGITGVNSRHEEHWGGAFRIEVKSGAQVSPVITRYKSARAQSEAARAIGDVRAFVLVCMGDGERSGLAVVELDVLGQLIALARDTGHLD
jgi:hypothetical protein